MSTATTFPESLGFRSGAASVHTSRTMMLQELTLVLNHVAANAPATAYRQAIIDDNALGKPTQTTRQRSAKRLAELYALDPDCSLFRLLRHFWPADPSSQPMLAFLLAAARDTLLREMTPLVVGIKLNEIVTADAIGEHLAQQYPSRFRPTTLHSTAQNLASSWTQAGYLRGKVKKSRVKPTVTPVVVSYAILLGYLCGLRGQAASGFSLDSALGSFPGRIHRLDPRGVQAGVVAVQGCWCRGGDLFSRSAETARGEGRL